MRLPSPPDGQVALLLQTLWDMLAEQSRWPTYGHVDRRVYQGHGLDIDRLLLRTPDTLLVGGRRQGGAEANPDEQLRLTVAGVAACSGTAPVVAAFLRAVQTAVRLEAEHTDGSEPSLTADEVIDDASDGPSRPNPVVGELALQVGLLLSQEWGWLGSCQLNEGGWRIGITRRVRAYKGVASLENYWTRRERARHAGEESLAVPRQGLPSVVVSPAEAIAKLEELRAQAQSQEIQREGALHDAWRAKVDALMATVLGPASGTLQSFRDVNYHIGVWVNIQPWLQAEVIFSASAVGLSGWRGQGWYPGSADDRIS